MRISDWSSDVCSSDLCLAGGLDPLRHRPRQCRRRRPAGLSDRGWPAAEQIYLRYIRRVTDANLMPSDFRETLACLLARELAVPVAQSNSLEEKLEARFRTRMRRARTTDGLEDQAEPMQPGAGEAVR